MSNQDEINARRGLVPAILATQSMTDEDKHAHMRRKGYPHAIFVHPSEYAAAEASGEDMRNFVKQKPIPT